METSSQRPLRRDAERNRQRIVAAARTLLAERGLGVSYEEIARAADVAVGTVYNRFPDRADLIDVVFAEQAGDVVALAERSRSIEDPWLAVQTFLTGVLELQAGNRGLRELAAGSSRHTALTHQAQQRINPVVTELVRRAQDAGVLRPDVGVADLALVPVMVGAIIDSTRGVDDDVWRRCLALVLDGMRPGPGRELPGRGATEAQFDEVFSNRGRPVERAGGQPTP